jgi:hypothetical protein
VDSRYLYSYSTQDKLLDLTDVDAGPFWSLLDEADARGVLLLDAEQRGTEIPRYRSAELLLDVTVAGNGASQRLPPADYWARSSSGARIPARERAGSHGLHAIEARLTI